MHNNGPTLFYDKSVIQSLSEREAYWLHLTYNVVMTSIFLVELMGNLEKTFKDDRSPDAAVAIISKKIPSWGFTPSVTYQEMILKNLFGYPIEMDGRPILGGARRIDLPDGEHGIWFDEVPEADIIRRWQRQDFTGAERGIAAQWQRDLQALDLSPIRKEWRPLKERHKDVKTDADLFEFVHGFLRDNTKRYYTLGLCMDVFDIESKYRIQIIERWKRMGRPLLQHFAPYAEYALLVDMFFVFGLAFDAIADTRAKHRIDFAYLYYIPFTRLFTSHDKLHGRFAPLFMRKDQCFVKGQALKEDLAKLTAYYEGLPEEIKATGTMQYARFPPLEGKFLAQHLYDKFVPDWRRHAAKPKEEISEELGARIKAKLKPFMDAVEVDKARR